MQNERTNFDRYLERKLQDAGFRARFEMADQAWDIALQLSALRQTRRQNSPFETPIDPFDDTGQL